MAGLVRSGLQGPRTQRLKVVFTSEPFSVLWIQGQMWTHIRSASLASSRPWCSGKTFPAKPCSNLGGRGRELEPGLQDKMLQYKPEL